MKQSFTFTIRSRFISPRVLEKNLHSLVLLGQASTHTKTAILRAEDAKAYVVKDLSGLPFMPDGDYVFEADRSSLSVMVTRAGSFVEVSGRLPYAKGLEQQFLRLVNQVGALYPVDYANLHPVGSESFQYERLAQDVKEFDVHLYTGAFPLPTWLHVYPPLQLREVRFPDQALLGMPAVRSERLANGYLSVQLTDTDDPETVFQARKAVCNYWVQYCTGLGIWEEIKQQRDPNAVNGALARVGLAQTEPESRSLLQRFFLSWTDTKPSWDPKRVKHPTSACRQYLKTLTADEELARYRSRFERTSKEFVRIKATPSLRGLGPTESKFGGKGYHSDTLTYPKDHKGRELLFIAQINCAELPKLPDYPASGLLQFFVRPDDALGLNVDREPTFIGSAVRFVPHKELDMKQYTKMPRVSVEYPPVRGEYSLKFHRDAAPISADDYRFSSVVVDDLFSKVSPPAFERYVDLSKAFGHKIGGCPYFTQTDPREPGRHDELLLQIDSQQADDDTQTHEILWGDVGVAQFFISKQDLRKRKFNNVLYTWDCS